MIRFIGEAEYLALRVAAKRGDNCHKALVAIKRSLDQHETKENKLEILKSDWSGAVDIANQEPIINS